MKVFLFLLVFLVVLCSLSKVFIFAPRNQISAGKKAFICRPCLYSSRSLKKKRKVGNFVAVFICVFVEL